MNQSCKYDPIKGYTLFGKKYNCTLTPERLNNPIGKGANSLVYLGLGTRIENNSEEKVAIKIVQKSCTTEERVKNEIDNKLTKVPSEHVCTILDHYEDDDNWFIAMPYFDSGNLTRFINNGQIGCELEAIEYFRQICFGLKTLHSLNLIHRDITTDNILVNKYDHPSYPYKYYMALSGYGLSKNKSMEQSMEQSIVGNMFTRAPEVESGKYDQKADVYSMGCILYKLLTKNDPFNRANPKDILNSKDAKDLEVKCYFLNQIHCSKLTMKILEGCLQTNVKNRLSFAQLSSLLDIDTLYSRYVQTTLDKEDISNTINLKEFKRGDLINMPSVSLLPIQRYHFVSLSGCVNIGHNVKCMSRQYLINNLGVFADRVLRKPKLCLNVIPIDKRIKQCYNGLKLSVSNTIEKQYSINKLSNLSTIGLEQLANSVYSWFSCTYDFAKQNKYKECNMNLKKFKERRKMKNNFGIISIPSNVDTNQMLLAQINQQIVSPNKQINISNQHRYKTTSMHGTIY